MNILLLYPEFPDTFWSFKHALRFVGKRASYPPLGLLTVAGMLPKEWNKRLVDLNVRTLRESDLAWADYAYISGMIVQKESAKKLIAHCNDANLKVVAGGPLFTMEHETFTGVDHFILNEAEITLPTFLSDMKNDQARRVYSTEAYPEIAFDFLGYGFHPRRSIGAHGPFVSFSPAVSRSSLSAMHSVLRQWRLHRRTDKDLSDLADHDAALTQRQHVTALQALAQRLPSEQLHDDIWPVIAHHPVIERLDHMRALDLGCQAGLARKAREHGGIALRQVAGDKFYGHFDVERFVLRHPHATHATLPKRADERDVFGDLYCKTVV